MCTKASQLHTFKLQIDIEQVSCQLTTLHEFEIGRSLMQNSKLVENAKKDQHKYVFVSTFDILDATLKRCRSFITFLRVLSV